jgi:hypothetical protein
MKEWIIVNNKTGEVKEGIYESTHDAYEKRPFLSYLDGSESMDLDVVPIGSIFVKVDTKWLWVWPDTPHYPG